MNKRFLVKYIGEKYESWYSREVCLLPNNNYLAEKSKFGSAEIFTLFPFQRSKDGIAVNSSEVIVLNEIE